MFMDIYGFDFQKTKKNIIGDVIREGPRQQWKFCVLYFLYTSEKVL